jgi:hypothetical protein
MKLIDTILEELKVYAAEFAAGETSKEEFNLQIDLLIGRVERIEINFEGTGIRSDPNNRRTTADVQPIFKRLLLQRKYRAAEALKDLQQPNISKRVFNHRVRNTLTTKLYFKPLEYMVRKNMITYHETNGGYILKDNIQLFITEGGPDHEQ